MQLYIPTQIYSEPDCVLNHAREICSYGKKALIVTGKRSAKANGSLKDITSVLKNGHIPYSIFDEIEENPSVETVMKARAFGLQEAVDFVIGVGGGSPLDAAKAIALMISNPEKTEEILYENISLPSLPVIAVPTTCGTGSEVTPYAILTLHNKRTKKSISHRVFPKLALLDMKYLKCLPCETLVNTAVDALAHLIESYLNTNSNELNRIYSSEGLRMFKKCKNCLLERTFSDVDYNSLLHMSMLGGMAIAHTGTSLPHGLSYAVTYELSVPHGKAVGIFLGKFMEYYPDENAAHAVLRLMGFDCMDDFINCLKSLTGTVNVENALMENNISELMKNPAKLKNYPFPLSLEELRRYFP